MRATSERICTRSFASRFDSGSSMRKTFGLRTIARPMATRWRWPPESTLGLRSSSSSRPITPAISLHALADLVLGQLLDLEPVGHVVVHAQVRVQRVVLEDHRDVALLRRDVVDDLVVDHQLALADLVEAGEHAQRGRLAAAGRADEHHELAVADLQVEMVDGADSRCRTPSRHRRT